MLKARLYFSVFRPFVNFFAGRKKRQIPLPSTVKNRRLDIDSSYFWIHQGINRRNELAGFLCL